MTSNAENLYVGGAIKAYRQKRNLSREALAALTGFNKSQIWRIEAGKTNPTVQSIAKICKVLDFPISEVFEDQSAPPLTDDEFVKLYLSKSPGSKKKIQTLVRWI